MSSLIPRGGSLLDEFFKEMWPPVFMCARCTATACPRLLADQGGCERV
jgi:hypothetical protein